MNRNGLATDHVVLTSSETLLPVVSGWPSWGYLIRCCFPFIACIFLIGFSGCVAIPTPEHAQWSGRGKIDESDIAFLSVSNTNREDVLLRFGEPDMVLRDQRILIYRWSVCHGYFIAAPGTLAAGPISKQYLFMLEFDEEGRLKRFERSGGIWMSERRQIDKWTPPGTERLSDIPMQNSYIDPIPVPYVQAVTLDSKFLPIRFRIGEFVDSRAYPDSGTIIGHLKDRLDFPYSNIQTSRPVNLMVKAAVKSQLQAIGHKLVSENANFMITGKVSEFEVTASSSYPDYVVSGLLDVTLEVQYSAEMNMKNIYHYKAKASQVLTMYGIWKESEIVAKNEQVMRECLEDMQRQIAADTELIMLFKGKAQ